MSGARALLTLGLAGGLDPVHSRFLDTPENYTYDGAAVLLADGVVVAAMEEERLNRIKHSNKFPVDAIKFCLDRYGVGIGEIDRIAYYVDERAADALLARLYLERPDIPGRIYARTLLQTTLSRAFACPIDPATLRFYEHRLTHAACAMHQSGFSKSLVYVIDNAGGLYHGSRDAAGEVRLEPILLTPPGKSIQKLCHAVLPYLGLALFEEYKALALAGQGDSAAFEDLVDALYELLPQGDYRLHLERAPKLLAAIAPPRGGAGASKLHCDLAASLQQAMQRIVVHVIAHHRRASGLRRLCMAGGMAENIATNATAAGSGLFDEVFVHPVAYDSGCALGAALLAAQEAGRRSPAGRVTSVGWGSDIGEATDIVRRLSAWPGLIDVEHHPRPARRAAALIAADGLIGWARERSDFGTHALGSRNVFARPDRLENRMRLHDALGRTERYRPLAVMVREEDLEEWCVLPAAVQSLPFQTFAIEVRDERRAALAAAVQADGTACVQSIARADRAAIWELLTELGTLTGSAAMLSASFNRSCEPTVETVDDAVACFLDSGLDHLILGDVVAAKTDVDWNARMGLQVALPPHVQMVRISGWLERRRSIVANELRTATTPELRRSLTAALGAVFATLDDGMPLADLLARAALDEGGERALLDEIGGLWSAGFVTLSPPQMRVAA